MNWSRYQNDVFNAYKKTGNNLLINAVAGSGKSTVLEQLNRMTSPMDSVLNVAFNVHIKDALKARLPRMSQVMTLNGVGWGIYNRYHKGVILNANKTREWLKSRMDPDLYATASGTINRIIGLMKHLAMIDIPEDWPKICDQYGVELGEWPSSDKFNTWLRATWNYSVNNLDIADYDDQVYQPIRQGWRGSLRDIVLVDEAQDLSPVQIELVLGLGRRIIAVGDPHQAIYVFRGADIAAIPNIIAATSAVELPLSVCYRCPTSVIAMAQRFVPHIEAAPGAAEGEIATVNKDGFWKDVQDDDYVLCRTTAPLVSWCLEAIRQRKKAFVRGRDIGAQLLGMIDKIDRFANAIGPFVDKAKEYRTTQITRLNQQGREVEAQALDDKIETLLVLCESCDYVVELEGLINKIFSDDAREGIEFSTIHKSKGGERARVWRLRTDLCPHPMTPPHLVAIENNLQYVQITRSLNFLGTIV